MTQAGTNRTADLMSAASAGETETVAALLDGGLDVNAQDANGLTALMHAVRGEQGDTVRLLLDRGADVNLKGKHLGYEALILAVKTGNAEIVELLLKSGFDVKSTDIRFASGVARLTGNARVIGLLKQVAE